MPKMTSEYICFTSAHKTFTTATTINLKELSDILWENDVPQYDYHFIDAPILEAYAKGLGWCFQRIIDLSRQ